MSLKKIKPVPYYIDLDNTVLSQYSVPFTFICSFLGTRDNGNLTLLVLDNRVPELESFQTYLDSFVDKHSTKEQVILEIHKHLTEECRLGNFVLSLSCTTSRKADTFTAAGNCDLLDLM